MIPSNVTACLYELAFIQKARLVRSGIVDHDQLGLYELAFIQKARRSGGAACRLRRCASMNSPSYRRRDARRGRAREAW